MTRNQAMYKWSGGCCWQHTCQECKNLICVEVGKRTAYKCLVYGNTGSVATDWKASYMACRHFNQPVPERPLIETGGQQQNPEEELPGQISIFDIWHTETIETDALSKCEPFCLPMPLTDFYIERSEFEVFGNVFDNPELLEVE